MRSMHIIGSRELGGAESFFMRLVLGLQAAGEDVISVNRPGSRVGDELKGRVTQERAVMFNQRDPVSRWLMGRLIRRHTPDIVQTYMTRATLLTRLPPGQRPVHVARLGGYYKVDHFRHAHAWIGNTKGLCDYLIRSGLPAARVHYIGNFVGAPAPMPAQARDSLRRQLDIPDDAWVVLAVGRHQTKKGFDLLLAALAQTPDRIVGRPVLTVFVGDGPQRPALQLQAKQLGLTDRLRWPGWQTDTAPYYALADLFVCPSRHEPLGNVILESWSHAKPVLSSANEGALELIEDGVDGLLVPCGEAAPLARAIAALLQDDTQRAALARAGHAKVNAHYCQPAIIAAYIELYRQLLRV
jgi:glycosyltransferase involved in cell wall biosynthesis